MEIGHLANETMVIRKRIYCLRGPETLSQLSVLTNYTLHLLLEYQTMETSQFQLADQHGYWRQIIQLVFQQLLGTR